MRYNCYTLHIQLCFTVIMSSKKTATLNLRIDPVLKTIVKEAAILEQRSVANLIEVLIRRHCEANGITVPEQQLLFKEKDHE